MTLRAAALVAGFAYLLNPVSYVQFNLYPKIVIQGNIEQTAQNIAVHGEAFVAIILGYLINFIEDVVIAWALYLLLAPANRALSLLTAWLRLMYTAIGLFGLLNLVAAYRLLHTPDFLAVFGSNELHEQLELMLRSFRYDWSFGLIIFGIHLVMVGYLIYRSSYIPKIIGILLAVDGLAWLTGCLQPFLYPDANLGFLFVAYLGELVFMLWLLIAGWSVKEPRSSVARLSQ
jgi:hypothetical protein